MASRREVAWTRAARDQLDEALEYIARDAPEAASDLLTRVLSASASLSVLSERGRPVPEAMRASVRELLVDPFRLVYLVEAERVVVLAVLHQRQDFRRWVERTPPNPGVE